MTGYAIELARSLASTPNCAATSLTSAVKATVVVAGVTGLPAV